jgi:ribosomal-protein-alanine N-acetyltransferase
MAFLRSSLGVEQGPIIRGRGVWMRPPQMSDYTAWAELRERSRDHLTPWEPLWPRDELSRGAYRRRLRHYHREIREDQGYAFLLFEEGTSRMVGGLTLSNLRRGVTQSVSLGYWLGKPCTGKGHMTEAVRAVLPFAFASLRLHRVEAACMPDNTASIAVLERNGFEREGYARSYLFIAGGWRDHLLFARLGEPEAVREARK